MISVISKKSNKLIQKKQTPPTKVEHHHENRYSTSPKSFDVQMRQLCSCDGGCPKCIQLKQQPCSYTDEFELEANRVGSHIEERISRSKDRVDENQEHVQRRDSILPVTRLKHRSQAVDSKIDDISSSLHCRGFSLPQDAMTLFQPYFPNDLARVRIHPNQDIENKFGISNARAFTLNNNIVFGIGEYSPETEAGLGILGHELTHVAQQTSSPYSIIQTFPLGKEEGKETQPSILKTPLRLFPTIPEPKFTLLATGLIVTIYFAQDFSFPVGDNYVIVEKIRDILQFIHRPTITIDGHASTEGRADYNKELSERRRLAVTRILRSKAHPSGELNIFGKPYGESKAEPEIGTPEEKASKRALNRRAEIFIPLSMPAPEKKPEKPIEIYPPVTIPKDSVPGKPTAPYKPPSPMELLEKQIEDVPPELRHFIQKLIDGAFKGKLQLEFKMEW